MSLRPVKIHSEFQASQPRLEIWDSRLIKETGVVCFGLMCSEIVLCSPGWPPNWLCSQGPYASDFPAPPPPRWWDYKYVLPHLTYALQGSNSGSAHARPGKHFIVELISRPQNWVLSTYYVPAAGEGNLESQGPPVPLKSSPLASQDSGKAEEPRRGLHVL